MACHNHKSKLKRSCVLHKCIQTWRAPAVGFWTLEIALSSSDDKRIKKPDKIKTLAHGYRVGWHGKPTGKQTGRQGNRHADTGGLAKWHGRWQGDKGCSRVTGVAAGWQGWRWGDRGGLAKWGKMNKCPLLCYIQNFTANSEKILLDLAAHHLKW